jgi:hypothetical protein
VLQTLPVPRRVSSFGAEAPSRRISDDDRRISRSSPSASPLKFAAFKASIARNEPPGGLTLGLQALWWDAKGDWDKAHECAQAAKGAAGHWAHAYLHRKEGDQANAAYWYGRTGKPVSSVSLAEEWAAMALALLDA